ncbi:MAG: hypothetical protein AB7U49_10560 [Hyphomicrobiaceae bacterium]
MDTQRLTEEIERVMRRRKPVTRAVAHHVQWLGADEDLERVAGKANASDDGDARSEPGTEPDVDGFADDAPRTYDAASTLRWVKKARRQRVHSRLREVGGWTFSILVVLAIITALGLSIYKPRADGDLRQSLLDAFSFSSRTVESTLTTSDAAPEVTPADRAGTRLR